MVNENDFYEERLKICKECPLFKDTPQGPKCNPKLYISLDDKQTTSTYPKLGFKQGCNCLLHRKLANINSKCIAGKW